MSEFVRSPSTPSCTGSDKGTKNVTMTTGSPLSVSSLRRQSISVVTHLRKTNSGAFVPALSTSTYFTPPPARRNSNPTGSSSGFCSYSPNESRTDSVELKCRRYSQPTSSSTYSTIADPLIKQEKASYSSLRFLPEVQTYLHFMEDTTNSPPPCHQRSNSFSGQNSLPGDHKQRKSRTRSQSRSPGVEEIEETCFSQAPRSHSNRPFGQYLSPSRSASMDTQVQHHPAPTKLRQMSLGSGGAGASGHYGVARPPSLATPPPSPSTTSCYSEDHDSGNEDQVEPIFRRCFERRRSSTIRTSFI